MREFWVSVICIVMSVACVAASVYQFVESLHTIGVASDIHSLWMCVFIIFAKWFLPEKGEGL